MIYWPSDVPEDLLQFTARKQLRLGEIRVLFDQRIKDALHIGDIVVRPELNRQAAKRLNGEA
jgi:hypothetical protein